MMTPWSVIDTWIVIQLIIIAVSAMIVGMPLVLRKESLLGDGISHAVLPGIALGYMISGERTSIYMLLGAVLMGVLTAVVSEYISTNRHIDSNAALGVVFSGLFAVGLILINIFARKVDLDPSCVLFGSVELSTLDTIDISSRVPNLFGGSNRGLEIPRAIFTNGGVLLLNVLIIIVIQKRLYASIFDPMFSKTIGLPVSVLRYIHVILVSITTVTAFESVGSILIIALLVLPQAISLLLAYTLRGTLLIGLVIAILASIFGHIFAITIPPLWGYPDTNTVGTISVLLGILLGMTILFSPTRGVVIQKLILEYHRLLIAQEDILKALYKSKKHKWKVKNIKKLVQSSLLTGRVSSFAVLLAQQILLTRKEIEYKEGKYKCTEKGMKKALMLQDTHRRWEEYLYSQVDVKAEMVHERAEKLEHLSNKHILQELKQHNSDGTSIPGHTHMDSDESS